MKKNSVDKNINEKDCWDDCESLLQMDINFNEEYEKYKNTDSNSDLLNKEFDWKSKLKEYFIDFISTANKNISSPSSLKKREEWISKIFSGDSKFINFNYTNTLQKLYGINEDKICFIHGKIDGDDPFDDIVFGNSKNLSVGYAPQYKEQGSNVSSAENKIKKSLFIDMLFSKDTYDKEPEINIDNNEEYFKFASICDEIVFMGFGFGEQDSPYVDELFKRCTKNCKFVFFFHVKKDLLKICNFLNDDFFEDEGDSQKKVDIIKW